MQLPVAFTHTRPVGQLTAWQRLGKHVPVVSSQYESLTQVCLHVGWVHTPCVHTCPVMQRTLAQLGTQAPF
jgi:hypothetical protein